MKLYFVLIITVCAVFFSKAQQRQFTLVIHGGAGTILRSNMTAEKEAAYRAALEKSLKAGYKILENGGKAIDAVEAAIMVLEDDPHFNAGKGAVFTNEGKNEMDAAIMDGNTLKAGAVASVTTIKNPITAARAVMDKSEHVLMVGKGAEKFAALQGCTIVDPTYFFTKERWEDLLRAKHEDSLKLNKLLYEPSLLKQPDNHDYKYGTVGAVALDSYGNIAAGTSTGGMTNKKYGRVGDSPIVGAGTYANNATCAISGTGWGEYFIRLVMAKSISDRMELAGMSLQDAANEMIMKKLPALGGDGGLIGIDKKGNITMPFCTEGMYRGYIKSKGEMQIKIYKE